MRDHSHPTATEDRQFCEICGKRLLPGYGDAQRTNKFGVGVTIAVHVAILLLVLFYSERIRRALPPAGAVMVYVAPLMGKPKPTPTPTKPVKAQPKYAPPKVQRLPNTITLPNEKIIPPTQEPPKLAPPPTMDMSEMVKQRQAARDAARAQSEMQAPQESEGDRATRIAKANIAQANGKSRGGDHDDTGGMFSVTNQTFHSADVHFRGWNTNFKRNWNTVVTVELGNNPDMETAIVNKMIELIRKEKKGDFIWDSQRLGHTVPMSARIEDTAELQVFLMKEMFPNYRPPRR